MIILIFFDKINVFVLTYFIYHFISLEINILTYILIMYSSTFGISFDDFQKKSKYASFWKSLRESENSIKPIGTLSE